MQATVDRVEQLRVMLERAESGLTVGEIRQQLGGCSRGTVYRLLACLYGRGVVASGTRPQRYTWVAPR